MSDNKIAENVKVIAQSRDINSRGWAKLVQFTDFAGVEKKILIPCSKLTGDCKEIKSQLFDEGLSIDDEANLISYLKKTKSDKYYLTIDKTGWYDKSFILPDGIIGNGNDEIYFPKSSSDNSYNVKGTLEDWKDNISKYCNGNSRLIFAVSTAFASTLLYILGEENAGFHFVGNSSCGKSTLLKVACSVWGDENYLKTWRATDNAIEGIANLRNDTLLVLDELGQIDPGKAGDVVYMLGNGQSKGRCNKDGSAKSIFSWRLMFLSSGEKELEDCGIESKKQIKAGQLVRMISIPAVREGCLTGIFENVHDKSGGKEFSEYLCSMSKRYYGIASREFIKCLISENIETIIKSYCNYKDRYLSDNLPKGSDSQVQRAINKFALVAFAGEMATQNGITGWNEGDAYRSSIECFLDWIKSRGGVSNQETDALLKQVKIFFEMHGDSRFLDVSSVGAKSVNNMAGYKKQYENEYQYWVYPEVFNKEICAGFKGAKKILYDVGWLEDIQAAPKKVNKETKRLYVILSKIWE